MRSGEAGEVGLVVQQACAQVGEMAHLNPSNLQESVSTHLGEAEAAEGDTLEPNLVLARLEVHYELLGGGILTRPTHQPELVSTAATVEVVGAGAFQHSELVIPETTQSPIGAGADHDDVVTEAAVEAVAIAIDSPDFIISTTAGDHIAAAGENRIGTATAEDAVFGSGKDGDVHAVGACAGAFLSGQPARRRKRGPVARKRLIPSTRGNSCKYAVAKPSKGKVDVPL